MRTKMGNVGWRGVPGMKTGARLLTAAAVAMVVLVGGANPAAADSLGTVRIGSSSAVGVQTNFYNPYWEDHLSHTRVVANFTSHTATTVRLTSIKVCYSDNLGRGAIISPWITNERGTFNVDWVGMSYVTGQCRTYLHSRTLYRQPTGLMMYVQLRIIGWARSPGVTWSYFYR
jgi:hypothetical protein